MKDNWTEAAFDMKEEVMKLKNFKPRPMREVEYFGETISIPADHKWVATDYDGDVYSYDKKPVIQIGVWLCARNALIGKFGTIREGDAANSLRHYPKGAK